MASTPVAVRQRMGSAERFFQRSLYLLLVVGFTALAGTGKLDFLSLVLGGSALVIRGYHLLKKRRSYRIPERWTNYLTIFYFLFYMLDYFLLSQGFVNATVHMVLFIMVVKIFSVQQDRDLLYLAVLSFLMVLAAAVLTVDTIFLLTFGLFMVIAMATFISMEMRRSEREATVLRVAPQKEHRFHRALSLASVLLAVFTMGGAVIIFFLLPRMDSRGYLRNLGSQSDIATGFSEGINLGGIGRIQQSNAPVMHVQVLHGVMPADLHWRGMALSNFDGHRWWNHEPDIAMLRSLRDVALDLRQVRVNGLPLYSNAGPASPNFTLIYRVFMEPVGTNVFFLADTPMRINGPYADVAISANGAVTNTDGRKSLDKYDGEADLRDPEVLVRNSDSNQYPAWISTLYLQLPNLDPRIPELARKITANATNNYARALAIETYLRQNLGYTLELPGEEPDPLANFLFQRKKGHCEYFASSMAVMLRTLGIPARVVNGFRGGQYNDLNQTWIIRGRDAHSWVEVYFPEYGWVTFDPTPSAPAGSGDDPWSRAGLYMDAARELWREWVINYDFSHQVRLSAELGSRSSYLQTRMRVWSLLKYKRLLLNLKSARGEELSRKKIVSLVALLLVLAALPFVPRLWRFSLQMRMARNPQQAPGSAASFWYLRMLKAMERRGIAKTPAQTPAEFASGITDPQIQKDVAAFTEHYERARFAESVEDAEQLPKLYEELVGQK